MAINAIVRIALGSIISTGVKLIRCRTFQGAYVGHGRMKKLAGMAFVILSFLFTIRIGAQECGDVARLSVPQTVQYLVKADDSTPHSCIDYAFHYISMAKKTEAVPALIELLGYKAPRADSNEENVIIAIRPNDPLNIFPAIYELYKLGQDSEPYLLGVITRNSAADATAPHNATYTLMLIHRKQQAALVQKLGEMSAALRAAKQDRVAQLVDNEAIYASTCRPDEKSACQEALKLQRGDH